MVLDNVYVIVLPDNKGILCDENHKIFFSSNAHGVWANVWCYMKEFYDTKENCLGIGMTNEELQKQGYRARKVKIVFD